MGCDRFELDIGILSEVAGDVYEVVHAVAPETAGIEDGTVCDLRDTYCEITLRSQEPVGFARVQGTDLASHPCYRRLRLEAYLGTPVMVDGEIYGTLNFSSFEARDRTFCAVDLDCVQLMAAWLGGELARLRAQWRLTAATRSLEQTRRRALVGGLVAAFRHELANPLAVALINSELISASDRDSEHSLSLVRQSLIRMQDVLRELAALAEDPAASIATFDLRNLVERTVHEPGASGRVRAQLESVSVTATESRVYQCLHNIIVAHLHGSGTGGAPVRVRCEPHEGMARVTVESQCERPMGSIRADLFAALRGESPFHDVPLTLATRIAEEYGGRVETVSTPIGTRTILELPAG